MANEQNLKPQNKRTKSEQREIARKGGIKSGEVRRKKKALKETMQMLLDLPVSDTKVCKSMAKFGIETDEIDNNTRLMYSLLKKAFNGDVAAVKEVRSVIGEDVNGEALGKLDELLQGLKDNANNTDR
jgi:hypothetical protein